MLKPNPVKIAPHFKIEPPYLSKKPESLSIKLGLGGSGLLPKYPSYSIGFVGAKYGVLPPPTPFGWFINGLLFTGKP